LIPKGLSDNAIVEEATRVVFDLCPDLKISYDWDTVEKDHYHPLHYHVYLGLFQMVVWLPEEEFEGRKFLYGGPDSINEFTPGYGDACIFEGNSELLIHGTSPLLSEVPVKSLGITTFYGQPSIITDVFVKPNHPDRQYEAYTAYLL